MRELRIQVPDALAVKIESIQGRLPEVIEAGLGEMSPIPNQVYRAILELLIRQPTPKEMMEFAPSPEVQVRVSLLLEKNRQGVLSHAENDELDEYQRINHLVTMMKARAIPYLSA